MAHPAMKIFSMYSDSDEEDTSPSHSNNKRRSRTSDDHQTRSEFIVPQHSRPKSFAPPSSPRPGEEPVNPEIRINREQAASRKLHKTSDWTSDDELMTSHDLVDEDDHIDDSSSLKEPPPPARPDDFCACSPSPAGARSPTLSPGGKRSATVPSAVAPKVMRIDSQSLVSYVAEEEEADEERRLPKDNPFVIHVEQPTVDLINDNRSDDYGTADTLSDKTSENTPLTDGNAGDELDSYALLEHVLDKDAPAEDSPAAPNNNEIELPPSPKEKCDPELVERFAEYMRQKKSQRRDFNLQIQRRKDFRNPSIYEKLIEHFQLDELGSNFKPSLFDPHGFSSSDYYEEISKSQRILMDKMEKDKSAKETAVVSLSSSSADTKRRSKWDNPAGALDALKREQI